MGIFTLILALFIVPLILIVLGFILTPVELFIRGYRFKKRSVLPSQKDPKTGRLIKTSRIHRKRPLLLRLSYDFPKQYWKDQFNRDPDEFNEDGLHLFCGEQGSGKTVAVAEWLIRLKNKHPKAVIRTNFNYSNQDGSIEKWQELVRNENGIYGQAEVIDEIQTWFNSMASKDFPAEMLTEISQQRKQRKMLIGTAQVFGRVAKPIREQTKLVYCPFTVAGCLTVVRVSKPHFYDDEKCRFKRYIRTYFFVHNDAIRNSFDTYKKIEGLTKTGFSLHPQIGERGK